MLLAQPSPRSENFPFSAFLNRDSFPFLRISRAMDEYSFFAAAAVFVVVLFFAGAYASD